MSASSIQTMIDYHCAACKTNGARCNPECYVKAAQEELVRLTGKREPEPEQQEELDIF